MRRTRGFITCVNDVPATPPPPRAGRSVVGRAPRPPARGWGCAAAAIRRLKAHAQTADWVSMSLCRRKELRTRSQGEVGLWLNDDTHIPGRICDVSVNGICVEAHAEIPPGTYVRIDCHGLTGTANRGWSWCASARPRAICSPLRGGQSPPPSARGPSLRRRRADGDVQERPLHRDADAQPARPWRRCAGR